LKSVDFLSLLPIEGEDLKIVNEYLGETVKKEKFFACPCNFTCWKKGLAKEEVKGSRQMSYLSKNKKNHTPPKFPALLPQAPLLPPPPPPRDILPQQQCQQLATSTPPPQQLHASPSSPLLTQQQTTHKKRGRPRKSIDFAPEISLHASAL
jgi:hypothetical protein